MNPVTVIITGMHRSGTSLVASVFQKVGLHIGERLVGPFQGNPRGHFEDVEFFRFHDALLKGAGLGILVGRKALLPYPGSEERAQAVSLINQREIHALWGWKDPRTCLFLDLWRELLPEARCVFLYRHPLDVALSLIRRRTDLEVFARPEIALDAWILYNQCILEHCRRYRGFCYLAHIQEAVRDLDRFVALVSQKLGIPFKEIPAQSLFEPAELRHVRLGPDVREAFRLVAPEAFRLYETLQAQADLPWHTDACQTPLPRSLGHFRAFLQALEEEPDLKRRASSPLVSLLLIQLEPESFSMPPDPHGVSMTCAEWEERLQRLAKEPH